MLLADDHGDKKDDLTTLFFAVWFPAGRTKFWSIKAIVIYSEIKTSQWVFNDKKGGMVTGCYDVLCEAIFYG